MFNRYNDRLYLRRELTMQIIKDKPVVIILNTSQVNDAMTKDQSQRFRPRDQQHLFLCILRIIYKYTFENRQLSTLPNECIPLFHNKLLSDLVLTNSLDFLAYCRIVSALFYKYNLKKKVFRFFLQFFQK